jgi:small subunit ribosomal protein S21
MTAKAHRVNFSVLPRFPGEDVEQMLKRFKRKTKHSGLIVELRKREYFVRPGELKRQKMRRKKTSTGEVLTDTTRAKADS